jgi:DNA repair protein RadC
MMNKNVLEEQGIKEVYNYTEVNFMFKNHLRPEEREVLNNAGLVYDFTRKLFGMDIETKEHFFLVCLNNAMQVLSVFHVSTGGITSCIVDLRMLFIVALNCQATQILIAHNHPSGNLTPSEADNRLTIKMKEASKLLDIHLIDHLIVSDYGYYSYADEGTL